MKKVIPLCLISCGILLAGEDIQNAITSSKINLDTRVFYFDRSNASGTTASTALTAGGIAKIETGSFYGLQLGLAGYGSYYIPGLADRAEGKYSSLLEKTNGVETARNISFIGESYAKYTLSKTTLQVGNQRLFTPLANDHDLRLLPSTYQASVLRSKELDNTLVELGWIGSYSDFDSRANALKDMSATWGSKGLEYAYIENSSIKNTKIRAQYAKAIDDAKITTAGTNGNNTSGYTDYRYLDMRYSITKDSFVEGQYAGNAYKNAKDSNMYGATAGVNFDYIDTALVYNKIEGNRFKAIESGPMYTDWQQGYGNYEQSQAFGGYVVLKPIADLTIKLARVNVYSNIKPTPTDTFSESLIDAWYKFNTSNKLRIRYSFKDNSPSTGARDRTDLRVVYYYSFAR